MSEEFAGSLGYAVWKEDGEAVRRLLAEGHDVDDDAWGKGIKTPLMESLDEVRDFYDDDRHAITVTLIEHGAYVHRCDEDGRTPLHYAAGVGAAAVELLLASGADVNARSDDGSTPFHEAVDRGSVSGVKALLRAGADVELRDAAGRSAGDLLLTDGRSDDVEDEAIRGLLVGQAS